MKRMSLLLFMTFLPLSMAQRYMAQHTFKPDAINFNLTTEAWRADLRYFAEELPKRHKNAFHTMTRAHLDEAVKQFNTDIPTLSSDEILVRFLRLIAMVGDGHTSIEEHSLIGLGLYPLRYEQLQDGVIVESASAEYRDIVGGKVVKIGSLPIEQAVARLKEISWGDNHNEQAQKVETAFLLSSPKVLRGMKVTETGERVSVTVEGQDGQQKTVEVRAVKDVATYFRDAKFVNAYDKSSTATSLYLRDPQNNYWFEYLKERKILYVQLNAIRNKRDEDVAAFFAKVFDFANNNPVNKFVLDVRMNTGGNNLLNKPIVVGLIQGRFNQRGKLFVVLGRRTFSAAQNLVNEIEKYTNAIFVGEPTGSSPNLYGDPVIMTLPKSKIPFRVSTLWHQIDPNDRRIFTTPEIFAAATLSDYRNNVDPAFQAILNFVPGTTFKDLTRDAAAADISVFARKYREFKTDPRNQFVNTEADTNALGYRLIQAKRIRDALEVFKLNVESYPLSANVYDSLAEGYLLDGNRTEAIKNYEKALTINPNFGSSVEALRRLKAM
jgi:tetratricopeptide (TPR) repeat protein